MINIIGEYITIIVILGIDQHNFRGNYIYNIYFNKLRVVM